MIVDENYRRRVLRNCLAKNFARMYERRVEQAPGYGDVAFQSMLRIQNCHMKFFYRQILQSLSKYFVHIAWTPDRLALCTFLGSHSATELECRVNRYCPCIANTWYTGKRSDGLCR